jgi:hypothetical protein
VNLGGRLATGGVLRGGFSDVGEINVQRLTVPLRDPTKELARFVIRR